MLVTTAAAQTTTAPTTTTRPARTGHSPLDLIPADSLLCWSAGPLITTPAADDRPSAMDVLLGIGARMATAGMDTAGELNFRIAEVLGLALRHPHAIALIDARAQPTASDPRARQVDELRLVLVVLLAEGERPIDRERLAPFLRVIQRAVNEQTDAGSATLTSQPIGDTRYQELRDQRLPAWAVVAWGQLGGYFVLTVGRDVWPLVADTAGGRAAALSDVEWVRAARARPLGMAVGGSALPGGTTPAPAAAIDILVNAAAIRERLDPFVGGRASDFFRAWNAEKLTWGCWSLRSVGRALDCRAQLRFGEKQTVERVYADPNEPPAELVRTVPEGLSYAIFRLPLERFAPRATAGLVAIQGPKTQAVLRRHWEAIAAERKLNLDRDLYPHLGPHLVVHNHPPHPLRLPLLATVLVELHGDVPAARRTLDEVCQGWAGVLAGEGRAAARGAQAASSGPAIRSGAPFGLVRESDGLWYMRFRVPAAGLGLAGPAWITTDRFVIVSWSPLALREYLADAGAAVGRVE